MKSSVLLLLLAIWSFHLPAQRSYDPVKYKLTSVCMSTDEKELYDQIMKYRKEKGLPPIPVSRSLTYVAQLHVWDLATNSPETATCNMHSWSAKGPWKQVCYTGDHKKAELMWSKPKELTKYPGNGYEIACMSSNMSPSEALNCWHGSPAHNNVILNIGIWSQKWNAVGIGMMGNYAVIWFGNDADTEKVPLVCT
jgi:hypothetical protein